jgi:O-antigen/teichoic acid export membrane protein
MQTERESLSLTSGRTLTHSVGWNVLGIAGPMVMAFLAIPVLVHDLGAARFGILTLIWGVVRYSSYCDFGVGTALTKLVSDRLGRGERDTIPPLVWTALSFMFVGGALVGCVVAVLCPWLVAHALKIPPKMQQESARAFYLLSLSMPFLVVSGGFRGVFAAFQRFGVINAVRGPVDILSYAGLILLATLNTSVVGMVGMLMIVRVAGTLIYWGALIHLIPECSKFRIDFGVIRGLLQFGGWMTITNLVNPLMSDFERFLIGALVSIEAVAYYNTSMEVLSKLWQIPLLLEAVWLSAFAHDIAEAGLSVRDGTQRADARLGRLFERGDLFIFSLMFPAVVLLVGFSQEMLRIWIGGTFAVQTVPVFRWLAIVILVSGFGEMPALLIQAAHRPDFTAKLRLIEIPLSVLLVWKMALWRGVEGVAIAALIRVAFDTVTISFFATTLFPFAGSFWSRMSWMAAAAAVVLVVGRLNLPTPSKAIVTLVILCVFAMLVWRLLCLDDDKNLVMRLLSRDIPRLLSAGRIRPQSAKD